MRSQINVRWQRRPGHHVTISQSPEAWNNLSFSLCPILWLSWTRACCLSNVKRTWKKRKERERESALVDRCLSINLYPSIYSKTVKFHPQKADRIHKFQDVHTNTSPCIMEKFTKKKSSLFCSFLPISMLQFLFFSLQLIRTPSQFLFLTRFVTMSIA